MTTRMQNVFWREKFGLRSLIILAVVTLFVGLVAAFPLERQNIFRSPVHHGDGLCGRFSHRGCAG